MSSIMEEEFSKALKKLEEGYNKDSVSRSDLVKFEVWNELLKAKIEAERERDAKKI